ncbi:MAG: 1-acyl-sn-glycerol-3-phosphate acyltransferase [Paludibacteraceae bacterium]|nr:1-acyl-sn-glycerol-3-phosphate acyltransferase [Paludibacteraceae bacterium]
MRYPAEFDDIRRLYDDEVKESVSEILGQPQMPSIIGAVLGNDYAEYFIRKLAAADSIDGVQHESILDLITTLEHKTCRSVSLFGTENVDTDNGNLFVSNHRDIILDSAFLNEHLLFKGLNTTQIAIGNNLFVYPWISTAVRLCKSFVVKRDGNIKEQFLISKQLSEYIKFTRESLKESIWIAQREGRAKDSDDRTAPAIIKMFSMSGSRNIAESVESLKVTPVSINYEFDPCDYLKAKEFQLKRDCPEYKKSPQDDLINMKSGLMGYKGKVSFVIGKPLSGLNSIVGDAPRNEQAHLIAAELDRQIHKGYVLYPNNFVAADMLESRHRFKDKYTEKDVEAFNAYLKSRIDLIDVPNKDCEFLRSKIIEMYANPAINQAAVQ